MRTAWVVMGVFAWFGLSAGSAWAVNKCVDAQGRTSFQDAPCADGQAAKQVDVTPASKGIQPPVPRAQAGSASSSAAAAPAVPIDSGKERPADCPDAQAMQRMQVEAESIALPLPIRNQKRQDFEALKQRCG